MRGLAIETSSLVGSVALFEFDPSNFSILKTKNWQREQSHSELVTPAIEDALLSHGWRPQDLNIIAISNGPGSFTGVRVAVNVARAMAYSLNIPVMTFNSHRALAEQARHKTSLPIITLTNAFKQMVFAAKYEHASDGELREVQAPLVLSLDKILEFADAPALCLGDGPQSYPLDSQTSARLKIDPNFSVHPSAKDLCRLCAMVPDAGQTLAWQHVKPLYIRASAAEENLESVRKSKK